MAGGVPRDDGGPAGRRAAEPGRGAAEPGRRLDPSLLVVALGGNALIRRGEPGSVEVQRRNLEQAAAALRPLIADGRRLVLTHGNGPQVGFLALEAEAAAATVPPPPLDVLGAESQGQIGYLLESALREELRRAGDAREVATLLTQTLVADGDPAFGRPTKPVGPVYDEATARRLAALRGWSVAPDGGGWRRVVPSPAPLGIVEAATIRTLVERRVLVVAAGGGGVPVVAGPGGALHGVEGVVDKDLAAVALALAVGAGTLLLLTDVAAVERDHGTPRARPIDRLTVAEARALLDVGVLPAGSMAPKVEACVRFLEAGGTTAAIGALADAAAVAAGTAGTRVVAGAGPVP
ncbi:MAG: carbamate kinase [Chloroflexota bacterium]